MPQYHSSKINSRIIFPIFLFYVVAAALILIANKYVKISPSNILAKLYSIPPPQANKHELVVAYSPSLMTSGLDEINNKNKLSGFEIDLISQFAKENNFELRFKKVESEQIQNEIDNATSHLQIGWLSEQQYRGKTCPNITSSQDVLIQHEASVAISDLESINGLVIGVLANSRQLMHLQNLKKNNAKLSNLHWEIFNEINTNFLLEALDRRKVNYILIDKLESKLALRHYPNLQQTLVLNDKFNINWYLTAAHPEIIAALCESFLQNNNEKNSQVSRLLDSYVGHTDRVSNDELLHFFSLVKTILPKYRRIFEHGQAQSGIDWRLLAAIAYQESKWDPLATSYTGVRGIMMLTEDTADYLRVLNRLDPSESIIAGARYLDELINKTAAPNAIEPDRQWIGIAAYNVGAGAIQSARRLAKQKGLNPDQWFDLKQVLPLLAKPEYYEKLASGKIRGGEAVIMVENIRQYYDVLKQTHRY